MAQEIDPIAGNWYRDIDSGRLFQVVAIDEDDGMIDLQHFDGDLEQIEAGQWPDLEVELVAEPEDWTGPLDETAIGDETAEGRSDWDEDEGEAARVVRAAAAADNGDEWSEEDLQDALGAEGNREGRRRATLFKNDADDLAPPADWEED